MRERVIPVASGAVLARKNRMPTELIPWETLKGNRLAHVEAGAHHCSVAEGLRIGAFLEFISCNKHQNVMGRKKKHQERNKTPKENHFYGTQPLSPHANGAKWMKIFAHIILNLYANAHVNMEMHNVGFRFVVWWREKHSACWLADEWDFICCSHAGLHRRVCLYIVKEPLLINSVYH